MTPPICTDGDFGSASDEVIKSEDNPILFAVTGYEEFPDLVT